MTEASRETFDLYDTWAALEEAIASGEAEGLYLECKSPLSPKINRDMKATLAKCVSGFANSAGGVLLCGVATTKHSHSSLDVLTQIEPIGNVSHFEKSLRIAAIQSATPAVATLETRIIKKRKKDTSGVVVLWVGPTNSDPVMSTLDNVFYFRSGDECVAAPYEVIKRQFAASSKPDVRPQFSPSIVKAEEDGSWNIPIILTNFSSAYATNVDYSVKILNPDSCEIITAHGGFRDMSELNPGDKLYMGVVSKGIHRNLPVSVGSIKVKMKRKTNRLRRLDLRINVYANNMHAIYREYALTLAKSGFQVKEIKSGTQY